MSKSRARFLSELLGTTGLVKKSKSALAGADEVIDLSVLPSIPNSKLTNSSITINSNATSLGGSVTLTTANVAENTNLYYTDARADARIAAADTGDLSEGSNLYYTNARADARVNLQTGSNLDLSSKNTGDLSEGSNLYYTNARADARIAAATTDDLSEGSSNLYYTDARADARVALVVDSAPSTLNTLNELAAALGDDANFSTTVTNSIAAKLPLAGGTLTGNLSIGGATPQGNLTIKGAASDDIDLLTFSEDGTNQSFSFNGNFAGSGSTGNNLTLDSYWTNDIMAWTGDGKVGIGTDSPDALLHVSATSPHIDVGPQGGNRAKFGYHSNDVIIGSTSSTGSIIFKNNISSTGAPQTDGDVKMTIADVGLTIHSDTYNILNLQTDSNNDQTSTDGIIKITNNNGSTDVTKAEFRWDESEDLVHVSYGDHGRHVSINSSGNVGINTGSTSPTATLDVAGTALVENAKLKAIAESNSDTARDVFVYDTRKDSDGGAWRKRTQNTSWYNETLNTSTRGARKEFPSVAVIVYEEDQLTIYDGDDPDMPMWMVINAGGGHPLYTGGTSNTCEALNGELIAGCGSASVAGALSHFNFIGDLGYLRINTSSSYNAVAIINRNTGFSSDTITGTTEALVNRSINDVAMTVLPNAPIDAGTGLPVPTIAVATEGGVSVIKDDGTVIDYTGSSGYSVSSLVNFTKDYRIRMTLEASGQRYYRTFNIGSSDKVINQWDPAEDDGLTLYLNYANGDAVMLGSPVRNATEKAVSSSTGLTFFEENITVPKQSLVSHATSSYNTGWMHGDIKLAALSDTDTTNISASGNTNILAGKTWTNNGSFPYETLTSSGLDITSAINTTAYGAANLTWVSTPGKTYTAYFNLTLNSGTAPILFMQTSSSFGNGVQYQTVNGVNSFTFTATRSGSIYFSFSVQNGVATNFSVANLELYEGGVADHSVNGTSGGLSVFGTVTKTAVATGAELVGYSGFSASNYLTRPHNNDFEFGTGNWSMMGWITQVTNDNSTQHPIQLGLTSGSSSEISILRQTSSSPTILGFRVRGDTNAYAAYPVGGTISANVWTHFVLTKRGSQLQWYINGNLIHSTTSSTVGNIGFSASDVLRIGHGASTVTNDVMKLALLRISATAPTNEQVAKMYNDEKHLFATNAKATLYGSSDAVTALAYDDATELLHVGTSAGRSEFQGLRRVNNTTDAVSAAISASNGFIVEE
jgi:hypothetical protein